MFTFFINEATKQKEKELHELEKENTKIKENLQKEKTGFSNFKSQTTERENKRKMKEFLKELKADPKQVEFECEKCDKFLPNESELKMHVMINIKEFINTNRGCSLCR